MSSIVLCPTQKYATAGVAQCRARGETVEQLAGRLKDGPGISRMYLNRGAVVKCRELSRSVWLYFPYIELVFLFYAFNGAVAAQMSALNHPGCSGVLIPSTVIFVSPPIIVPVYESLFQETLRKLARVVVKSLCHPSIVHPSGQCIRIVQHAKSANMEFIWAHSAPLPHLPSSSDLFDGGS